MIPSLAKFVSIESPAWLPVFMSCGRGVVPETMSFEARLIARGRPVMLRIVAVLLLSSLAVSQDTQHQQGIQQRGDKAMGFSHNMTTHHFVLTKDGGMIEVEADDPNDSASRDAIRQHLDHIASLFKQGDFNVPMFIHDQTPPGVSTMKRLKDQITYDTQLTPKGAEVKIASSNAEAVSAIHQFLKFQIEDHQTGDSTEVSH
jgi:hypothetical protein